MIIKLFEQYNSDEYYQMIDYGRYYELFKDTSCMCISRTSEGKDFFTQRELEWFEKRYDNIDLLEHENKVYLIQVNIKWGGQFSVTKLPDEYYLFNFYGKDPYLCDQFDGVIKLIEDLGI